MFIGLKEGFLIILGLVWIIFAVVQDLKKREIANWLNFSLIIFALGFRFFWSLFNFQNEGFSFFVQGLIGLGIFFVLGNLFYYSRIFAGGDAKLMIALGSVLPLYGTIMLNLEFMLIFILLFIFSGAIYGLIVSVALAVKNFNEFRREFRVIMKKNYSFYLFIFGIGVIMCILGVVLNFAFLLFGVIIFLFPYLYISAKSIEEVCMVKEISSEKLTEGDWIYKRVKISSGKIKRFVEPTWDGLSRRDITLIRKHNKKVLIKQGIPYSPAFLIGFILWAIYYLFVGSLSFI